MQHVMTPVEEVEIDAVEYQSDKVEGSCSLLIIPSFCFFCFVLFLKFVLSEGQRRISPGSC